MMTEPLPSPRHPPFVWHHEFLETAFERRFQGLLQQAWSERSWHVIAAVPGSGKSLGISDLCLRSGASKETNGTTRLPILAIRAPKNAAREQALGLALSAAFGVVPSMPWALRRSWLVQILASCGVECLIIDDAQDLRLTHLALLNDLTDNLAAPPYQRHVGLCLVAAHSGNVIPFKETFAGPDVLWRQFRRRMDTEQPYCVVLGHTEEEIRPILRTFEELYRSQLLDLHLRRWSKAIFTWLSNPILDPDGSGRVTMDHLSRLAISTLRRVYQNGGDGVKATTFRDAGGVMVVHHEEGSPTDGTPPVPS